MCIFHALKALLKKKSSKARGMGLGKTKQKLTCSIDLDWPVGQIRLKVLI